MWLKQFWNQCSFHTSTNRLRWQLSNTRYITKFHLQTTDFQSAPNAAQTQGKQFKHIKQLLPHERTAFLNSFDVIYCDCDGVIWQSLRDPISGSAKAIASLRNHGKQVTFVTNNSIEDHFQKFEYCNIPVDKHDVMHPAQTVCNYLQSKNFAGLILCLATQPFKNFLRSAGYQLVEEQFSDNVKSTKQLHDVVYSKDPVKAVVIDIDFNMNVSKLMRAHVHLKDPECLFIGGAADVVVPFGVGDVIGSGPFINVVETSSKRKATVLGKPGKALGELLQQRHNLQNMKRALFVGDSLTSDIQFGNMCGFQTLLVLSGGTKANDLQKTMHETEIPDFVADSLADLNEFL